MKRLALVALFLAACRTTSPAPATSTQAAPPPATAEARTAWKTVIDAPDRSEKDRALDPGRHPAETLEFLDLKPGMKVADVGAGGGYTTELIARAVGPGGIVYMQNDPSWLSFLKDAIAERFTHAAAVKNVVRADVPFGDVLPPEAKALDAVVSNVIYHDLANMPVDRARMNRIIFNALKPGGEYVVIDSSARDQRGLADTETLHRIDEAVVKDEVEKAGFKLVAQGAFLRNPDDARDWDSSPDAAAQAGKRGQNDRFALKFARPAGSTQQIIAPRLRLPLGVRPVRFTAELAIDPASDDFHGTGDMEISADAPVSLLWLNADTLEIRDTEPRSTVVDAQPGFVGLQFEMPLPAGTSTVKLRWQGKISRKGNQGLYRQQENGLWYVLSQGEPLGMRKVIPCFDEPSFKIPWKISLRVPRDDAAYFNTPQVASEEQGDAKMVRFAETKPLPSYLLAFGVGPFERVDAGKIEGGGPIGIIVTRGKAAWATYSAQSSPKLMRLLGAYFQVPYSYPKLDLIEVPVGGGAMENPGLITFAQRINLARPGTDTPQFFRRAASVEAHEMAHLWFGDLVTNAWWDDIWLNEAFATWMTHKAIEQFEPGWGTPATRTRQMEYAMGADSLLSARRIRQPIESEGDIKTAFDAITYQKGAAVIGMFEQWIGAQPFRRGVTRYLKEHADGNATAGQFLAAISAEAGKDVAKAFSTFLDQGGLPLVSAKVVCDGGQGKLDLSQMRYLPLGAGKVRDQVWQIPVCVRSSSGSACTLLAEKTGTLKLEGCPQWVMLNAGASGYYRTFLDGEGLAGLTKNVAALTVPERISLLADVDAAAHAGNADIGRSLQLVRALASDRDRQVIEELVQLLREVRRDGIVPADSRVQFGSYVRAAFSKRALALGLGERAGESDDTRILRPALLRLEGDEGLDLRLRADARTLALRWLSDHKAASPEMASAVLYLAAIDADAALWDKLHGAAKAEKDRVERQRILEAMGAVRDPQLAEKNFALFLSDEFDAREAAPLLFGANDDARTRDPLWAFVQKNFDAINGRLPQDFGPRIPWAVSAFCDDDHADAVKQFFRPHIKDHPGLERTLAQVVEEIGHCAAFKARQGPALAAFLRN